MSVVYKTKVVFGVPYKDIKEEDLEKLNEVEYKTFGNLWAGTLKVVGYELDVTFDPDCISQFEFLTMKIDGQENKAIKLLKDFSIFTDYYIVSCVE